MSQNANTRTASRHPLMIRRFFVIKRRSRLERAQRGNEKVGWLHAGQRLERGMLAPQRGQIVSATGSLVSVDVSLPRIRLNRKKPFLSAIRPSRPGYGTYGPYRPAQGPKQLRVRMMQRLQGVPKLPVGRLGTPDGLRSHDLHLERVAS